MIILCIDIKKEKVNIHGQQTSIMRILLTEESILYGRKALAWNYLLGALKTPFLKNHKLKKQIHNKFSSI